MVYDLLEVGGHDENCPNQHCHSDTLEDATGKFSPCYSVEEETTLTYLDLIRRAIQEKYELNANE
jgi:hypothetical protein